MTFLEFCIAAEWGKPTQVDPGGRTWWVCQFHADSEPSFATRPHDPQYRDRWNCFGCGERGDLYDFLRLQYPDHNYGWQIEYVDHLYSQFEATITAMAEKRPLPEITLLGERGGVRQKQWNPFGRDFDAAQRELWEGGYPEFVDPFYELMMLEFAARALDIADRHGVDPGWLRLAVRARGHALKSRQRREVA